MKASMTWLLRGMVVTAAVVSVPLATVGPSRAGEANSRPNILFVISDDQSAAHVGAYGDAHIRTPNMDRLAREGVRFENAFTACPSCTPSRSAILTGQPIYRLEQSGLLMGKLLPKFPMWTVRLQEAGYEMGSTGKTWAPGFLPVEEFPVHPFGKAYTQKKQQNARGISPIDYAGNFEQFLSQRAKDRPFCFWLGTSEPHQVYEPGLGRKQGKKLEQARLFGCWPDRPEVREEVLDYSAEIEHVDTHLGRALAALEKAGELQRTMVVFTADHGNPLPRAKCNLYDAGTRVPLLVRFPGKVRANRVLSDFVSLPDLAPTMLEAAGVKVPAEMTAPSLWPLLTSTKSGRVHAARNFAIIAFERHTLCRRDRLGYPMRAMRTEPYLYIRNYEPDRWPAGDPDLNAVPQGYFGDIDAGAVKKYLLEHKSDPEVKRFYELAVGRRPAEELYDLKKDPEQLENVAARPEYAKVREEFERRMREHLMRTGDPRANGRSPWDFYPYYGPDGVAQ